MSATANDEGQQIGCPRFHWNFSFYFVEKMLILSILKKTKKQIGFNEEENCVENAAMAEGMCRQLLVFSSCDEFGNHLN